MSATLFVLILFVFAVLAILYSRGEKHRSSIAHIPGPRGLPIVGNLIQILYNWERLPEWLFEICLKYGHTVSFWYIGGPVAFVGIVDPESVEHILKAKFKNYVKGPRFHKIMEPLLGDGIFAVDGLLWKKQRQVASHQFSISNLKAMTDVFHNHSHKVLSNINSQLEGSTIFGASVKSGVIDISDQFFRYTLDSIGVIAFGTDIGSLHRSVPFADAFDRAQVITDKSFINPIYELFPSLRGDKGDLKILDDYVYDLVHTRREENSKEISELKQEKFDLLSRYLDLKDEDGNPYTNKYLRDIILNFVIAGRDTTAQLLSWAFHLLSLNPDVQEKLYDEISQVLPHKESDFSYDDIRDQNLPYLKGILNETLRLYPSVPVDIKEAAEDDTLPNGIFIPKGTWMVYSPWVSGRHPDFWENPEKFQPERWEKEQNKPWTFIPFQGGPRICLGMNMAYLEAKTLIVHLVRKYRVSKGPGSVSYKRSLTLPPKNGIKVFIEERR